MSHCLKILSCNPEQRLDDEANDLVRHQEEHRRDHDEDKDHAGGDHGFTPGRPGDFADLGTDFADEFDWILRHARTVLGGRSGGTRTPGPRFWRPMLYQLSYTPTCTSAAYSTLAAP